MAGKRRYRIRLQSDIFRVLWEPGEHPEDCYYPDLHDEIRSAIKDWKRLRP